MKATLYVDMCDPTRLTPGSTLEIDLDPEEHLFTRANLGNSVRGVFATYKGVRMMLLTGAANPLRLQPPGCAVSIAIPQDGNWGQGKIVLDQISLESIGKAVVEISS